MSSKRSATDRVISRFAQAYRNDTTPYPVSDFHPSVKSTCASNKTGTVSLQVSKCIVVGDVSVGKTCLVNRFCNQVFDRDYKATIGVDFEVERFDILNTPFNLQIWDTAGQERFKCIAAAYYRGAHVIVIVFDLTDTFTLEHVERWHEEALRDTHNESFLFLVGTKKDLCEDEDKFHDTEETAIKLARKLKAEYWTVSSLTGENVENFFFRVASLTFNMSILKVADDNNKSMKKVIAADSSLISLNKQAESKTNEEKSSKCCNS